MELNMKLLLLAFTFFISACTNMPNQQDENVPIQAISTNDLHHPVCGFGW